MPHFVYMLRCKGNRIYTGYAVDVQARFEHHKSGKGAKFTKAFPPECILRTFELETKEMALRLEARIKKLTREQKALLAMGGENKSSPLSEALEKSLLSGLSETLVDQRKRVRCAKKLVDNQVHD